MKKKGESTQVNKIRNEKGEVTTDTAEIQSILRDYYKQLSVNKMDNLEEMDKFLERYNFPRLNQEEIENMNRPITSNEIETVISRDGERPAHRDEEWSTLATTRESPHTETKTQHSHK